MTYRGDNKEYKYLSHAVQRRNGLPAKRPRTDYGYEIGHDYIGNINNGVQRQPNTSFNMSKGQNQIAEQPHPYRQQSYEQQPYVRPSLMNQRSSTSVRSSYDNIPKNFRGETQSMKRGRKVDCEFFLKGECKRGDNCSFLHDFKKDPRRKQLCKHLKLGICSFGKDCKYSHDIPPCKFFLLSRCKNEKCKFSHAQLGSKEREDFLHNMFKEQRAKLDKIQDKSILTAVAYNKDRDFKWFTKTQKKYEKNPFLVMGGKLVS